PQKSKMRPKWRRFYSFWSFKTPKLGHIIFSLDEHKPNAIGGQCAVI
ncbi:MAG: hypothetical protein FD128_2013, partial [Hyphomonadaceae bacterium]